MNRAGMYHNNLKGAAAYQSFRPNPLPPVPEVELAKLDTASRLISNADLFISMYVRKEALISSQIEGTQYALNRLKELPLCCRLIREIHEVLMDGVRGQDKTPGEFRCSQNWIGPANCALKDARYIPPNVEDMQNAMTDLEKYINENTDYDPLIRVALIHYQFETIHPFLDDHVIIRTKLEKPSKIKGLALI